MTNEKKYLYKDLSQKTQDKVFTEASLLTAQESDDLLEAEQRATDWIKNHDYPKTIHDWETYAQ